MVEISKRAKNCCGLAKIFVTGLDEDVEPDDQLLPEKLRVLKDLGLRIDPDGFNVCFCRRGAEIDWVPCRNNKVQCIALAQGSW